MDIKAYIKTLDKYLARFRILHRSQHASGTNIAALLLLSRECKKLRVYAQIFPYLNFLAQATTTKKALSEPKHVPF